MPHHPVTPRRYRLRLLNLSGFRAYNVHLSNGAPMVQIGADSGLMPKPARRSEILLGPAERAEVIVDFAGAVGESVDLRSGPRHGGPSGAGSRPYVGALMQFRVDSPRATARTPGPRQLRPLPGSTTHVSQTPEPTSPISTGRSF